MHEGGVETSGKDLRAPAVCIGHDLEDSTPHSLHHCSGALVP
jgi:hypothetical protein